MPERIQMTRSRPWRARHPQAVRVDRATKWGNPFRHGDRRYGLVRSGPRHAERFGRAWDYEGRCSAPGRHDMWFAADDVVETYVRLATRGECVELYQLAMLSPTPGMVMAYGGLATTAQRLTDTAQLIQDLERALDALGPTEGDR